MAEQNWKSVSRPTQSIRSTTLGSSVDSLHLESLSNSRGSLPSQPANVNLSASLSSQRTSMLSENELTTRKEVVDFLSTAILDIVQKYPDHSGTIPEIKRYLEIAEGLSESNFSKFEKHFVTLASRFITEFQRRGTIKKQPSKSEVKLRDRNFFVELAKQIEESGLSHDQVSFLKTYRGVILGSELTDYIFDSCQVSGRQDAVAIGQLLVLNGLLSPVSVPNKAVPFEDRQNAFYKITPLQPKDKKRFPESSEGSAVVECGILFSHALHSNFVNHQVAKNMTVADFFKNKILANNEIAKRFFEEGTVFDYKIQTKEGEKSLASTDNLYNAILEYKSKDPAFGSSIASCVVISERVGTSSVSLKIHCKFQGAHSIKTVRVTSDQTVADFLEKTVKPKFNLEAQSVHLVEFENGEVVRILPMEDNIFQTVKSLSIEFEKIYGIPFGADDLNCIALCETAIQVNRKKMVRRQDSNYEGSSVFFAGRGMSQRYFKEKVTQKQRNDYIQRQKASDTLASTIDPIKCKMDMFIETYGIVTLPNQTKPDHVIWTGCIQMAGSTWYLNRKFSDFENLYHNILKASKKIPKLKQNSKKGNKFGAEFLKERLEILNEWFSALPNYRAEIFANREATKHFLLWVTPHRLADIKPKGFVLPIDMKKLYLNH